jgi:hypothetical protein
VVNHVIGSQPPAPFFLVVTPNSRDDVASEQLSNLDSD